MKGAIFDMDGLLFDTENICIKCEKVVLKEMGYEFSEKLAYDCIGKTIISSKKAFLEHFGEDFPIDEYTIKYRKTVQEYIEENGLDIKDGVIEILEYFKNNGFKIALGTSSSEKTARSHLERANILHYFEHLATGDMVENGKPAPDIFLLASQKLGLKPSECYVFEDSFNGVKAGHTGGFFVVMVPDIVKPTEEIKALTNKICEKLTNFL